MTTTEQACLFPPDTDAALYTRHQYEASAILVEAFTIAVVISPDEPAPFLPTARACFRDPEAEQWYRTAGLP